MSPLLSCRVVMGSITMWSRRYSYHFISLLLVSYLSNIHPSFVHFFLTLLSTFLVLCPHVTSMIIKVESSEVVKARKEAERASNKPLYQQLAGTQSRLELFDYLPAHLPYPLPFLRILYYGIICIKSYIYIYIYICLCVYVYF